MPGQRTRKAPWWQQATALVTVSTGGVITGLNFAPGTPATMTSPNAMPLHLLAMQQAASGALGSDGSATGTGDAALRPAIVNIARHYLHLARGKSPAEMEALIWASDSVDGAGHGPSCAAFASLTLELAAQAVGQQSWVTGGGSYPWPLHSWADVRVDPNPDSMQIASIMQDAQAHSRWHAAGDGYAPQPGDWVLFRQHVEVATGYSGGVLHTIGADSLPGLTVNAHSFSDPLASAGIEGFVDNGHLAAAASGHQAPAVPAASSPAPGTPAAGPVTARPAAGKPAVKAAPRAARTRAASPGPAASRSGQALTQQPGTPGAEARSPGAGLAAAANIPGLPTFSAQAPTAPRAKPAAAKPAAKPGTPGPPAAKRAAGKASPGKPGAVKPASAVKAHKAQAALADIPGVPAASQAAATPPAKPASPAARPAQPSPPGGHAVPGPASFQANIPGVAGFAVPATGTSPGSAAAHAPATHPPAPAHAAPAPAYHRHVQPTVPAAHAPSSQQAFINAVAPGAMAAQQQWGVPASVTIAQAIEESAWGNSGLAASYHNLFGIKGSGPAGSVMLPTQEFQNGQWVTVDAPFRAYHNMAESISDHAQLLATSGYYTHAMADRHSADAFAGDLTGVYATDPHYGSNLISIMRLYNLYRYDAPAHQATPAPAPPATGTQPPATARPSTPAPASTPAQQAPSAQATPSASPSDGSASASAPAQAPATGHFHAGPVAAIPGQQPASAAGRAPASGGAAIPGLGGLPGSRTAPRYGAPAARPAAQAGTQVADATTMAFVRPARTAPRPPARAAARLYEPELPDAVKTAFFATARTPIARAAPMYKDIASQAGISWKLLAACDWMQCQAQPHLSPVHGERLGTLNQDGTVYSTRSAALAQCATDLIELASAVYLVDLTVPRRMSVQGLADVFAAFRWGGLLRRHRVSSMEFPYSVEGLSHGHQKMRWPAIDDAGAPDKPGTRFRMPFGAVPIVLSLDYRATV
jgi:flagellum-specific peptidoglycan hydrolase FlgJ